MSGEAAANPVAGPAAPGDPAAEAPAPTRRLPVRLLLLLVGAVLLVAGLSAWGWLSFVRHAPAKAEAPEAQEKPAAAAPVKATLSVGSVVVNIGAPDTRRYLKVGVEIGVTDARETKELEEHKAQIVDLVISIFGAASLEVLGSEEGRLDLKKALLERIHEELRLEKVSRVYFTEFVIQ